MLSFDLVPAVAYREPWNQDLSERLRMLVRAKMRVAYFYEKADNSTFRYRIYNMVQVLNNTSGTDVSASYFFLNDLDHLAEIADHADMLVICRSRYDNRIGQLITAFRQRNKRVLFDIDDFVFNTDFAHLILKTLDQDTSSSRILDDWFAYSGRLGATLKLCDGAITTNDYLAQRIRDFAPTPVSVAPNFLNREQLELSERIYSVKQSLKIGQGSLIQLGYFSGSPSHNRDFNIIVPALEALLEENHGLGLVVVGYIKAGSALEKFGSRVKSLPFQDFINLQRIVGSVAFNLMPLQFNVFTNSKSELKYFESAIVGTQSIASPTYTYARAIRDGENGYLAQAHEWISCIRKAVANLDNYQTMAERAFQDSRSRYAWYNQNSNIMTALGLPN
jgi:hypothetical protein